MNKLKKAIKENAAAAQRLYSLMETLEPSAINLSNSLLGDLIKENEKAFNNLKKRAKKEKKKYNKNFMRSPDFVAPKGDDDIEY